MTYDGNDLNIVSAIRLSVDILDRTNLNGGEQITVKFVDHLSDAVLYNPIFAQVMLFITNKLECICEIENKFWIVRVIPQVGLDLVLHEVFVDNLQTLRGKGYYYFLQNGVMHGF